MEVKYKNHFVDVVVQRISNSRKCSSKAFVRWLERDRSEEITYFDSPADGFETEESARAWGFKAAKQWIEEHTSALLKAS
jgi:hypothetical protein